MTDIEQSHLDTAYVHRDRMYKCIRVRDQLRDNIREYLDKQVSKSLKSNNSKKTRGVKKGGKRRKTKIKSRKSNK